MDKQPPVGLVLHFEMSPVHLNLKNENASRKAESSILCFTVNCAIAQNNGFVKNISQSEGLVEYIYI